MKKKPTSTNSIENIFNSAGIEQTLHYWTPGDLPALTYKKMRNLKLLSSFLLIAGILSIASCRKPYSQSPADLQETPAIASLGETNILESSTIGTLRVVTLAGDGTPGYLDGTTIATKFNLPSGIAMDASGNVYVADAQNHRIRKITSAGVVSTLAGNSTAGTATGVGTAAQFNNPSGLAVDAAGNVYVADKSNHAIRKISPAGEVTNLAGIPNPLGQGSTDGPASTARFNNPAGVAVDATGNVYVADAGNHKIRKITVSGTTVSVSTFAGNGSPGTGEGFASFAQFNTPSGVAVNVSGTAVYVADAGNNKIRKIVSSTVSTLAGGGGTTSKIAGFLDATGTAALFNTPTGIAVDASGNVWVADKLNHAIRQVTAAGVVTTQTGNGSPGFADNVASAALFNSPTGIAVDIFGNVFIADQGNQRIRKTAVIVTVSTVAGSGSTGFFGGGYRDGDALSVALFRNPNGISVRTVGFGAGTLSIADIGNNRIRTYSPNADFFHSSPYVSTFAGNGTNGFMNVASAWYLTTVGSFSGPHDVASDASGNEYVADNGNHSIRLISDSGLSTLAGNGTRGFSDGQGTSAQFDSPWGVGIDGAGNVYVADAGNHRIRKVTPGGMVSTVAGSGIRGFTDGDGAAAAFNTPSDVAVDAAGNIYVADRDNHCIRKISQGKVTTFAGNGSAGFRNGPGATAQFNTPSSVAVDVSGNVYVSDQFNNCIRKVTPSGAVSTLAGNGTEGYVDGLAHVAQFALPGGLAIDASGVLYVADVLNHRIRKIQ